MPLRSAAVVAISAVVLNHCDAFIVGEPNPAPISSVAFRPVTPIVNSKHLERLTPLNAIIDVPMGFFTTIGLSFGVLNGILRPVNRQVLEERAWQRRLDEARKVSLEEDPTLTELDLIREEAENLASPYGTDAMERRERAARRARVATLEREDDFGSRSSRREGYSGPSDDSEYVPMTDEEIEDFEAEYGVEYDPYYDEPFEEDELPEDSKFYTDGLFLDRRYENGEVFYWDDDIGMYWRQGCKPRIKKTWNF